MKAVTQAAHGKIFICAIESDVFPNLTTLCVDSGTVLRENVRDTNLPGLNWNSSKWMHLAQSQRKQSIGLMNDLTLGRYVSAFVASISLASGVCCLFFLHFANI